MEAFAGGASRVPGGEGELGCLENAVTDANSATLLAIALPTIARPASRKVWPQPSEGGRIDAEDQVNNVQELLALEGPLAAEKLVQHHAERPNVRATVDVAQPPRLLG